MATVDERRGIAAKLREMSEWEGDCLVDCEDWGERVLNLLDCGDTESECYSALADLIDPADLLTEISCLRSCLADTEENASLIEGARKKEHRELLELARIIDLQADDNVYDDQMADGHWVAQAIREAIGA